MDQTHNPKRKRTKQFQMLMNQSEMAELAARAPEVIIKNIYRRQPKLYSLMMMLYHRGEPMSSRTLSDITGQPLNYCSYKLAQMFYFNITVRTKARTSGRGWFYNNELHPHLVTAIQNLEMEGRLLNVRSKEFASASGY